MEEAYLLVDGVTFRINRTFLIESSRYFEALLSKNFKESSQNVIEIRDVSLQTFTDLIEYFKDYEMKRHFSNLPRFYRLPNVFRMADMFCMDRFLRYLRKVLCQTWFKIGNTSRVLAMANELNLKEELLSNIAKDFVLFLEEQVDCRTLNLTEEHITADLLDILLECETFWVTSLKTCRVGYFGFMERLLKLILCLFKTSVTHLSRHEKDLFQTLITRTKLETLDLSKLKTIVTSSNIQEDLENIIWSVYTQREAANRSRLKNLCSKACCALSARTDLRHNRYSLLDLEDWTWSTPTAKIVACSDHHNYGSDFCNIGCVVRVRIREISSQYRNLNFQDLCASATKENSMWFVMSVQKSDSKHVFQFSNKSFNAVEMVVLDHMRMVHCLVAGSDGVLYFISEPSNHYGNLCIYKYTLSTNCMVLLASVDLQELHKSKMTLGERYLKRECEAYLVGNTLHIFVLLPSYLNNQAYQRRIHLYTGLLCIETKEASKLKLKEVLSYEYSRPREQSSKEFWTVYRKGNNVVFALVNKDLFLMRYDMSSGVFRHLGFLPSLPDDFVFHSIFLKG